MRLKFNLNFFVFSFVVLEIISILKAQRNSNRKIKIPLLRSQSQDHEIDADFELEGENGADLVSFHLYNNNLDPTDFDARDVNDTTELRLNDTEGLLNAGFKLGQPVKILIHGFRSSGQNPFPQLVKNAYLTEANGTVSRNIICVDWGRLANGNPLFFVKNYIHIATKNVPKVGERVGRLLEMLVNNNLTTLDVVHIVGHSLGAHVSGLAGDYVFQKFGVLVPRITGLDPAGPLFYSHKMGRPVTSSDATFVDIIHTDAFALGKAGKIGHADFYPNGGTLVQDNCRWNGVIGTGLVSEILTLGSCSHSQAYTLYKNSIGNTNLRGCQCFNYVAFMAGMCSCEDGDENQAILGENILPGKILLGSIPLDGADLSYERFLYMLEAEAYFKHSLRVGETFLRIKTLSGAQ